MKYKESMLTIYQRLKYNSRTYFVEDKIKHTCGGWNLNGDLTRYFKPT